MADLGHQTLVALSRHWHLRILMARLQLKAAEAGLRDAVVDAVLAGDSWAVIGAALGTSRQNAYQRYASAVVEVRAQRASGSHDPEQHEPEQGD